MNKNKRIIALIIATIATLTLSAQSLTVTPKGKRISPTDTNINYVGRINYNNPESPQFTFPGIDLEVAQTAMNTVVEELHAEGEQEVYRFDFTPQDGSLGYGADWHPSMEQQQKMADELIPYVSKLMGWK